MQGEAEMEKFSSSLNCEKRHIVVGGSGLIGNELVRELNKKNINVIGTYTSHKISGLQYFNMLENDWSIFEQLKKNDVVYLMSAYSNPNWIAKNRDLARALNLTNTKKLIDVVSSKEAKIVFMSSVEVFDGKRGFYDETDEVNPLNFYGEMKAEIEQYLKQNAEDYVIVRTGWNVGLNRLSRCVVALTYETISHAGARMATDNIFSISHVSDTARGLSKIGNSFDEHTIHLCSSEPLNRFDLAAFIKSKSRMNTSMSFNACKFSEINYSEPRGRLNHLNNNFSIKKLNLDYTNSLNIVREKVKYLDAK